MRRKWRTAATADLSAEAATAHQSFGSAARYEAMLWREFSLGNVAEITSQVPGWYDDAEIADALREARRRYLLPWEFNDQEWNAICQIIP
jgi:hypothetical protein